MFSVQTCRFSLFSAFSICMLYVSTNKIRKSLHFPIYLCMFTLSCEGFSCMHFMESFIQVASQSHVCMFNISGPGLVSILCVRYWNLTDFNSECPPSVWCDPGGAGHWYIRLSRVYSCGKIMQVKADLVILTESWDHRPTQWSVTPPASGQSAQHYSSIWCVHGLLVTVNGVWKCMLQSCNWSLVGARLCLCVCVNKTKWNEVLQ